MSQKLLVSKSKLDNTLNEYDKVYSSALTWHGRMKKENDEVLAADSGQAFVAYGESTSAYMDKDLSDFIGHVNIMKCALTESLSKTNALIARSEDFVNVLRGEGAMDSDSYANCSSSGDIATFYDDHCPEEAGYEGSISRNTQNILKLGIKEEEELVSIENELESLKTVKVSVGGQSAHIRTCIEKQNYTDPLFNSLKSYGTDVRLLNNYVAQMNSSYFPTAAGDRTHVRSYNYSGAPSGDKEAIYTYLLNQEGYSIEEIRALEQYLGLSAFDVHEKLASMSAVEASQLVATACAAKTNSGSAGSITPVNYVEYHTGNTVVDAEIDRLFSEYGPELEGIREDNDWDNWPEVTKQALAVIFDKDMAKINESFSDAEVATEERTVSNILVVLHDGYPDASHPVLDQDKLKSFTPYLQNDISRNLIDELANTPKYETGWTVHSLAINTGATDINVRIDKAGILVEYVTKAEACEMKGKLIKSIF